MGADDTCLLRAIGQGDRDAFAALYDRTAPVCFALAAAMVGTADAEEVVQDAYLNLWQRAGQYDPERGQARAWMLGIVRNAALDRLRQRGREARLRAAADVDRLLANLPDAAPGVEATLLHSAYRHAVREAIRNLPDAQRLTVVLAYFGGMTQRQIAGQLEIPLGTVKKRIRLAMHKLRDALQGERASPAPSQVGEGRHGRG